MIEREIIGPDFEVPIPSSLADMVPKAFELEPMSLLAASRPPTVLYVHGIKNKPTVKVLKCQWDMALFGQETSQSRMAYWVDARRWGPPKLERCSDPDETDGFRSLDKARLFADDMPVDATDEERLWLLSLEAEMLARSDAAMLSFGPGVPLMRWFTRQFMRDAHDYFFRDGRQRLTDIFLDTLAAVPGPVIVLGHSLGSVIAYDALRHIKAEPARVPLFVTMGSPMGLGPVKSVLRKWSGPQSNLDGPACVSRWVNIKADRDVVALDGTLRGEYPGCDVDTSFRHRHDDPHAATLYLTYGARGPVGEALLPWASKMLFLEDGV